MILWILCGPPGAGKTTFLRKRGLSPNEVYISRDEIRFNFLKNNESYFEHENMVFAKFVEFIQEALDAGKDVFADATHLNWPSRKKLIKALKFDNIDVNCIVFTTQLEICRERNSLRQGRERVPDDVLANMYDKFTDPKKDPYIYNLVIKVNGKNYEYLSNV